MKEDVVEIDGEYYTATIENNEVQNIYKTDSYRDTESYQLAKTLQTFPETSTGNFCVHVYESVLLEVLDLIGDSVESSDLEIVRMEESKLSENAIYIEWEQDSAMGRYDTPEHKEENNSRHEIVGEGQEVGV